MRRLFKANMLSLKVDVLMTCPWQFLWLLNIARVPWNCWRGPVQPTDMEPCQNKRRTVRCYKIHLWESAGADGFQFYTFETKHTQTIGPCHSFGITKNHKKYEYIIWAISSCLAQQFCRKRLDDILPGQVALLEDDWSLHDSSRCLVGLFQLGIEFCFCFFLGVGDLKVCNP